MPSSIQTVDVLIYIEFLFYESRQAAFPAPAGFFFAQNSTFFEILLRIFGIPLDTKVTGNEAGQSEPPQTKVTEMNTDRFLNIPADEYHAASKSGQYMSSHLLADFRESPELYRRKTNGEIAETESPALACSAPPYLEQMSRRTHVTAQNHPLISLKRQPCENSARQGSRCRST